MGLGWLKIEAVDAIELSQQGQPFEVGRTIAAGAAIAGAGGADDRVVDRVELSARLLEGKLHRAGPLHAIGGDKSRGDARADD